MMILFVCTGNTCRSPMASALLSHLLESGNLQGAEKNFRVCSAGIYAGEGEPPSQMAVTVMQELGIDISGHRSVQLNEELITAADLILTMTKSQRDYLLSYAADLPVYALAEYAGAGETEVQDPFGMDLETYRLTLVQIKDMVDRLLEKIIES